MKNKLVHNTALRIAFVFFVFGIIWILLSDSIVLALVKNNTTLSHIQTFKGWAFVAITSVFIFVLVNRVVRKQSRLLMSVNMQFRWQQKLISNLPDTGVYLINKKYQQIFNESSIASVNLQKVLNLELKSNDNYSANGNKSVHLKDVLFKVFEEKHLDIAAESGNSFLEIHASPLYEKEIIEAILLVVIDRTQLRDMIRQINQEKRNFRALSEKYHGLNNQLSDSYKQLKTYNSELLENKERYSAFIQQTSEAVYRIDFKKPVELSLPSDLQVSAIISNAYLAEYNTSFAQIYGLNADKTQLGLPLSEVFKENNHGYIWNLLRQLVSNNFNLKNYESAELDSEDQVRYFLNNMVGIIKNNKLNRFWGTKLETTRQKRYETELIKAKKAAEQSDKLKSAFLANMSHEIRTPLNGIIGFSELVCNTDLPTDKKEKYFNIIQSSNQQLLRIINDILDISRLQTGQLPMEKAHFPLNQLMSEIKTALEVEMKRNNKKIKLELFKHFPDGEDDIYTDKERLYQIITNLTNNAIKFTENGSVSISYTRKSKTLLLFTVRDTGIGIPDEFLDSIFDQFRQVEEFANRKYGGTGLGLSISQGLVQLLGGNISVESEPNVGSAFHFTIKIT